MAADVVGYSRLMAIDEGATLAALKLHRSELFDPKITTFNGRVVKLMGDGILAEFSSVVEAVQCAVEIQQKMAERNADVEPGRRLDFRIGINLGDIIVEGDDIYGDGVNVAARLEGLAEPGGICISRAARDQVLDKVPIKFEDLGDQQVKTIPRPIRAFGIMLELPSIAAYEQAAEPVPATPVSDLPSIAVLPFTNMSNDPEQEYFSDGITEDIITGLCKNRSFFVISRGTSFSYKGASVDLSQIAQDLGVRYVLEGSVRKAGNRVRISAQLSDAPVNHQVWAERYDHDLEDIFAVQDEITQNIIGSLAPGIMSAEVQRARRKDVGDLESWDLVMRAHWHIRQFTKDDTISARGFLQQALELDSNNAAALSDLAFAAHFEALFGWSDEPKQSFAVVGDAARRAVTADDQNAMAHTALAIFELFSNRHDDALRRLATACDLDPNHVFARGYLGVAHAFAGDHDAAMPHLEQAVQMSPRDPLLVIWHIVMGWASMAAENYQQAAEFAKIAIEDNSAFTDNYSVLAASLGQLGESERASAALKQLLQRMPGLSVNDERLKRPFKRASDKQRFVDGLVKAGLPEA